MKFHRKKLQKYLHIPNILLTFAVELEGFTQQVIWQNA